MPRSPRSATNQRARSSVSVCSRRRLYSFGNIAWREGPLGRSFWLYFVRSGKLSFFEGLFRREQADYGQGAMFPPVNDRRQLCLPALFGALSHEDHRIRPDCPVGSRRRCGPGQRTRRQKHVRADGSLFALTLVAGSRWLLTWLGSCPRAPVAGPPSGGRLSWLPFQASCSRGKKCRDTNEPRQAVCCWEVDCDGVPPEKRRFKVLVAQATVKRRNRLCTGRHPRRRRQGLIEAIA